MIVNVLSSSNKCDRYMSITLLVIILFVNSFVATIQYVVCVIFFH